MAISPLRGTEGCLQILLEIPALTVWTTCLQAMVLPEARVVTGRYQWAPVNARAFLRTPFTNNAVRETLHQIMTHTRVGETSMRLTSASPAGFGERPAFHQNVPRLNSAQLLVPEFWLQTWRVNTCLLTYNGWSSSEMFCGDYRPCITKGSHGSLSRTFYRHCSHYLYMM